jgi:hypothetical protein
VFKNAVVAFATRIVLATAVALGLIGGVAYLTLEVVIPALVQVNGG